MDTPEVMVLAALRGDVQDAVGMYNVQESFELEYISKLVSAWQGNTQPGDEQVSSGSSPCHLAASLGHLTALRSLIENNSLSPDDPDNNGRTPIMMACAYGHLSVVRYLREVCKVNIESSDVESMTPILMAAMFGHHHIVKYLSRWLAHKSGQYHYADKELGGSILHWACLCGLSAGRLRMIGTCDNRYVETVRFIVKELKVPINARTSSDDSTPLAWACGAMPLTATKKKIVEMLVYYGADVHAVDNT
ncbi:ESPN, partial [Symbiodinium microadriaticum]